MRLWPLHSRRKRRGLGVPAQPFEIEIEYKEVVIYWEGDHGYWFTAGWGVDPPVLYVPAQEIWDRVVPDWLHGRWAEVTNRLATETPMRHRLKFDRWVGTYASLERRVNR